MFTYLIYKSHELSFNVLLLTIVGVITDIAVLYFLLFPTRLLIIDIWKYLYILVTG